MNEKKITVPLTVPQHMISTYEKNYYDVTKNTGRFLLFAGDQKIEHLHDDFFGPDIDPAAQHPEHLFAIANTSSIGAFATHLGLAARYGAPYKNITYIIKLNAKTHLISPTVDDPCSRCINTVADVLRFEKEHHLKIAGFGYTVYLGSKYEHIMLSEAARIIQEAHAHGKLVVLWMYPRGASVAQERSAQIIAGATGVATSLGADFVKVNPPQAENSFLSSQLLQQAVAAAGNTGVLCSGGPQITPTALLECIYHQIHTGKTSGVAIGRNIHQHSLEHAQQIIRAIAALLLHDEDVETAKKIITF